MNPDGLLSLLAQPDSIPSNPRWNYLLAPYIESALAHATTYSHEDIRNICDFFVHDIAPHLGPGPLVQHDSYQPQYPSSITSDLTPFELSLCWKDPKQQGNPIVRFVNDIIPPNADRTRVASLIQSERLIEALGVVAQSSTSLTLHVLPDIWKIISHTLKVLEYSIHPHPQGCLKCGSSSAFIGFDLKESVVSGKFYWRLPSCQSVTEVLNLMDAIFSACNPVHEFFQSTVFSIAWSLIRQHIYDNPDTLQPRMLSIDATAFPAPRIKIYVRCHLQGEKDFDTWEQNLHLNNSVTCPQDFRSTCSNLWTSLATNPVEWAESRPDVGPKSCLLLYEITASSSDRTTKLRERLSSKLYIMCQEIPRSDQFIAIQLLRHCPLVKDASILKAFAASTKTTSFISEIGLAPRTQGTEVSIYLNPSFFASKMWAVGEDGFMVKPRITLR